MVQFLVWIIVDTAKIKSIQLLTLFFFLFSSHTTLSFLVPDLAPNSPPLPEALEQTPTGSLFSTPPILLGKPASQKAIPQPL